MRALHEAHNAPDHASGKRPWPHTSTVGFLSCELNMHSLALSRKTSALEAFEVIDEVLVRCMECRWLLDMLPMGIALAQLALVKAGGYNTWVSEHLRPRFGTVHAAAAWLFMHEIQVIGKLLQGNMSGELCQRTVNSVEVMVVGLRVHLLVHPGYPTE